MNLQNIEALYLIIPLLVLWFFIGNNKTDIESFFNKEVLKKISTGVDTFSSKTRLRLLILAMIFMVIALSKPVWNIADIKVEKRLRDLVIAIDISKSMFANDVYPNRFEFAKNQLLNSLAYVQKTRIALLGFSNQAFLISPLTEDFSTLQFLLEGLNLSEINQKGTSVFNTLQSSIDLFHEDDDKSILLLTDGGDDRDFSAAISYAQKHNIKVSVYDISTQKGSAIADDKGFLKDENGNIVFVKSNPNIAQLARQSGGKYLKYTFKNTDLATLINTQAGGRTTQKNTTIKQTQPLFYYPLSLALILLFMTFFSLPKKPE